MKSSNLRWRVKKTSRKTVAFGSLLSGTLLARRAVGRRCMRVLTYHRFGDTLKDPFCVTVEDFDDQMRLLAEQRRAVSLQDLREFLAGKKPLPPDACLVTIDDGMVSTLTHALPVLRRWNIPAVAFVSTSLIERNIPDLEERFLTWDELRELSQSGLMEIGSHAHTHRSLALMTREDSRSEAQRSREILEARLNREIATFAYPFGTRTDFNRDTDRTLEEAGYSIAFHSLHGAIRPTMAPVSLPRVKIEGGEPLSMFSLISRGAMDPWRIVDNNLWRLQRVRREIA